MTAAPLCHVNTNLNSARNRVLKLRRIMYKANMVAGMPYKVAKSEGTKEANSLLIEDAREYGRLSARGWRSKNPDKYREISRQANKRRWKNNPEKIRQSVRTAMRKAWGFKPEAIKQATALESQKDRSCAICGENSKKLCIDHDHITGNVRGVLCNSCNLGLGMFRDSLETIEKAIVYLKRPV